MLGKLPRSASIVTPHPRHTLLRKPPNVYPHARYMKPLSHWRARSSEKEVSAPSWWPKYEAKAQDMMQQLGLDVTEEDITEQFVLSHVEQEQLEPGSFHRISEGGTFVVKVSKSRSHGLHELSIIQHLSSIPSLSDHVPSILGTCVIDGQRVLVLPDAGQPLTSEQWTDPQVLTEVFRILHAVHAAGVANGDLKPSHVLMSSSGRISIIDWDSAAILSSRGAKRPPWVDDDRCKYLSVPNDHFWAIKTGTPAWAAVSQHLGYGPSPSGDAESLGYIVLDKLAGAPWLHPDLPAAKDLEAEMKILASCGCLNMTIFGTRECAWPEVPNSPQAWKRFWEAVKKLELSLRSPDEFEAVGHFMDTILQIVGESAKMDGKAISRLTKSLGEEQSSWSVAAVETDLPSKAARPSLPTPSAATPDDTTMDMHRYASETSRRAGLAAEARIRTLLQASSPGKLFSSKKTKPVCEAYPFWRQEGSAEVDVIEAGESAASYIERKGAPFQALEAANRSCRPVYDGPSSSGRVFGPKERTDMVGEMIVTKDQRYAVHKFEQVEASIMREGICHPLEVADEPIWAALLYATLSKEPWDKKQTLQMLGACPRCRVLHLLGGLVLLKVEDEEVRRFAEKIQELTFMTVMAAKFADLEETVLEEKERRAAYEEKAERENWLRDERMAQLEELVKKLSQKDSAS